MRFGLVSDEAAGPFASGRGFQPLRRTPTIRIRAGGIRGISIKAAEPRAPRGLQENINMQLSHRFRVGLIALIVMVAASISSAAHADVGFVRLSIVKGGWFIGAHGGWGELIFHGRRYPLSVGGLDAGLVFGVSQTTLVGRVINIRSPWDITGVYGAAGAGAALAIGARAIALSNDKGAILQLQGPQIGLIANLDLSGLAISLR
jgi:hypothetical protein